jgi:hypothetical protein
MCPNHHDRPDRTAKMDQSAWLNWLKRRQALSLFGLAFLVVGTLQLVACGNSAAPTPDSVPADYSQAQNWETLPNASQAVDVFFVYPTTYKSKVVLGSVWTPDWNESLAQAYVDEAIKSHVTSKTGVFAEAGTNLYVPYYQQASGLDALNALLWKNTPENASAANAALQVAYTDVSNAFDYYLAHFNRDASGNPRPFILAAHSQGSNLLLTLLEDKFSDPALRRLLVVAYVIGWSVTSDDMDSYPASLAQVGICGIPGSRQTGCIVTYNTQQSPGDWSLTPGNVPGKIEVVQKNAYSVNPLTWVATGPGGIEPTAAPAAANMGALFYQGQLTDPCVQGQLTDPCVTFTVDPDTGDFTFEIFNYTGAQSNNGALVIDPTALPAPAEYKNLVSPYNTLPGWYHSYDYTFFYRNLQQNVVDRITAYGNAQQP